MKKFIIIKEEAHGIIGYAPTYVMAIYFLVDNDWLENLTEEEVEELLDLGIEDFNKKYDGKFEMEDVKCDCISKERIYEIGEILESILYADVLYTKKVCTEE